MSGATVQDIETQRQITRSSLTAVSLQGLTALELGFAVLLAIAGAGLVLALGLDDVGGRWPSPLLWGPRPANSGPSSGAKQDSSLGVASLLACYSAGEWPWCSLNC